MELHGTLNYECKHRIGPQDVSVPYTVSTLGRRSSRLEHLPTGSLFSGLASSTWAALQRVFRMAVVWGGGGYSHLFALDV